MITFISNLNNIMERKLLIFSAALPIVASLMLCSCSVAASTDQKDPALNQALNTKISRKRTEYTIQNPSKKASLQEVFNSNFNKAIFSPSTTPNRTFAPVDLDLKNNAFGMKCTPVVTEKSQYFEITLPEKRADRAYALAVITPEGRIYDLYSAYGENVEEEDLVVPSLSISWLKAYNQNKFSLTVNEMSGIKIGDENPFGIFIEEGNYQFALVNSTQRDQLVHLKRKVKVFAGCVINFKN